MRVSAPQEEESGWDSTHYSETDKQDQSPNVRSLVEVKHPCLDDYDDDRDGDDDDDNDDTMISR